MEKFEVNKLIEEFSLQLSSLNKIIDVKAYVNRIEELEKVTLEPNFYKDQNNSKKILLEISRLKTLSSKLISLQKEFDEIKYIYEEMFDDFKDEIDSQINEFKKQLLEFETINLLSFEYDNNNCYVEIHPGAGGTESHDWALMVYQMLTKYANTIGLKVELLDYLQGEEAGIKSVTMMIKGEYAYGKLISEKGVHRLVRISPFDSNSRRHTSFCAVDVSPELPEANDLVINDEDLKIDVYRSGGAGGQSVNTTDSAVRIKHIPTGIVVSCQNERSQIANRKRALDVLKTKILEKQLIERQEKIDGIKGAKTNIDFGTQIRSYVLHPYTLVKDNRSNYETSHAQNVLNGELKEFNREFLRYRKNLENENN